MWELIAANKRKSVTLAVAMALCLCAVGAGIGIWFAPARPETGAVYGAAAALFIWIVMCLTAYYGGDSILLSSSRAHEVTPDVDPRLWNVVEEMKIASGLPAMPKVYIIDEPEPNAFATGVRMEKSAVAVTAGLLKRLNRDELQGVIAHEMSHIQNRDVLYMTFSATMLGSIQLLSEVFFRGHYGGTSRRFRSRDSKGGGAIVAIAIVLMIVGPILARILYFAMSRRREYLADASGARLTRYPEGLASALERISAAPQAKPLYASSVTAPMFIVNPFDPGARAMAGFGHTHPPIQKRVAILRAMGQSAAFGSYERAYRAVLGKGGVLPGSAAAATEDVPVRAPSAPEPAPSEKAIRRGTGDLIRALNGYAFLLCACGLKIKLPPDFGAAAVECPRCGRSVEAPHVEALASLGAGLQAPGTGVEGGHGARRQGSGAAEARYHRTSTGWETFACSCGKLIQLSPSFAAPGVTCSECHAQIRIE